VPQVEQNGGEQQQLEEPEAAELESLLKVCLPQGVSSVAGGRWYGCTTDLLRKITMEWHRCVVCVCVSTVLKV
jgi:hypothetical protein